jgi:S-formylglutathione hydrolase FrmB
VSNSAIQDPAAPEAERSRSSKPAPSEPASNAPASTEAASTEAASTEAAAMVGRLRRRIRALIVTAVLAVLAVLVAVLAAGWLDAVPLLSPALAATIEVLGGAALVASWVIRQRTWALRILPLLILGAAALTAGIAATLRYTELVTDDYPVTFGLWVGAALAAIAGLPLAVRRSGRMRRLAAAVAAPLTMAGAVLLINNEYGTWPRLGDMLGHHSKISSADLDRLLHVTPDGTRPAARGVLADLDAPATTSHFSHQRGSVYLPPAYFTQARDSLPVLLMLGGTPGSPAEWVGAGAAVASADAYAATHGGFAPVMIFADENGTLTGDTECVDGPRGHAETYLTVDVPRFIAASLHLPHEAERWAVVGFSAGGTCAFDLVLDHPRLFRHFVDLAGEALPQVGPPHWTLWKLFGGSANAQAAHDTYRLLAAHRYPGVSGWFAAGTEDPPRLAVAQDLAVRAAAAGMNVHTLVGTSGHSWQFANGAFAQILPHLCADMTGTGPPG